MCELDQLAEMPRRNVNRRQFTVMGGALGLGGAIAACAPVEGVVQGTSGVTQTAISFAAPGGTMDGVFLHPATGKHPGVLLWPDIAGVRPAAIEMGRRLAGEGYAVLVANPYYRSIAGQPFADFDAWREGGGMQKVGPWMQANTPDAIGESAAAIVAWLDKQGAVDTSRGVGTQGYCMTGGWTIRAAAAAPERVKAAASFHGGGLVGDEPNSPVNLLDNMGENARAIICIARNDDAQAPDAKTRLKAAADAAGLDADIEVFQGDHGWTVLDSPVYNQAEAERAWAKLLAMYAKL